MATTPRSYYRFWRWHFYAGLLIAPIVLIMAVTGGIYLFQGEIEDALYSDLLYLKTPYEGVVDHDALIASAKETLSFNKLHSYQPPISPRHAAQIVLTTDDLIKKTAFIDPANGTVLGAIDESTRLTSVARELHKGLMLGKPGRWLAELAACWLIVMLGTGLYLWWPRGDKKRGAAVPKLDAKGRNFWRELHAVPGAWMSLWILAILLAGLPWSAVWGGILSDLSTRAGEGTPKAIFAARPQSTSAENLPEISMNALIAKVDAQQVGHNFKIDYPWGPKGSYVVMPLRLGSKPQESSYVFFDKRSGEVLEHIRWEDMGKVGRLTALGVAFHEGRLFGRANQLINALAVLTVIGLVISGFAMWLKRKPAKALGAPRTTSPITKPMLAGIAAVCIMLPLLGASVLTIWVVGGVWKKLKGRHA